MKRLLRKCRCIGLFVANLVFVIEAVGQVVNSESFDGTTFPPAGWTQAQLSGSGLYTRVTSGEQPTCRTHSGAGMLKYDSFDYAPNTSALLATPSFDLASRGVSTPTVSFWMYRDNGYPRNADSIQVYVDTDTTLAGATYLGTINRSRSLPPTDTVDGWHQYTFDIPPAFNGHSNYILFCATSQFGDNMFLDDVVYISYMVVGSVNENEAGPEFALRQNYPNPFNPSTTIEFHLAQTNNVRLQVFSLSGEKVATLVSKELNAGTYRIEWDAKGVASGVYLYRLTAGLFVVTKKLMVLR